MIIFLLVIVAYCGYLHYRISQLQEVNTSVILDLIDDVCNLEIEVKILKDKKCCDEKPRRKPAKIRSRLPKTTISKD
tara:strand:+ start:1699 stop:1929 length:231 start_codon:yes stop_codon:yes gene_type:complete